MRAPFLLSEKHGIVLLNVCLRAAQMLLSIYFEISASSIRMMAAAGSHGYRDDLSKQLHAMAKLPPTWRQVRRITTSIFIIIYALWKGEAFYDETCRGTATAILLLEFQRVRWGGELQEAKNAIREIAALSGIKFRPFLQQLVPDATEEYIVRIYGQYDTGISEPLPGGPAIDQQHPPTTELTVSSLDYGTGSNIWEPSAWSASFLNLDCFADAFQET